jgi:hypothetical protein
MLLQMFYYTIFKIPSKFDYKLNINVMKVRFIGMGLKCNILDVIIF